MAEQPIVQVVLDYEQRQDGTEHIVFRGVFKEGEKLPERNTIGIDVVQRNVVQAFLYHRHNTDVFDTTPPKVGKK